MKIPLYVKNVTPSFIHAFNGHLLGIHRVIPHQFPLGRHESGPHCVHLLVFCFISVLPSSQAFLPQRIFLWCSLCLDISAPPFFTQQTLLVFWFKGLFPKDTVSASLGTGEFLCSLLSYQSVFFLFALMTTVFKWLFDKLVCGISVLPTRFSRRQAPFLHYCCPDTQYNTSQIEVFFSVTVLI